MFVMEGRMLPLAGFLTVSAGVGYTMYSQLIPMEMLQTLQGSTILLVIISKVSIYYTQDLLIGDRVNG